MVHIRRGEGPRYLFISHVPGRASRQSVWIDVLVSDSKGTSLLELARIVKAIGESPQERPIIEITLSHTLPVAYVLTLAPKAELAHYDCFSS